MPAVPLLPLDYSKGGTEMSSEDLKPKRKTIEKIEAEKAKGFSTSEAIKNLINR